MEEWRNGGMVKSFGMTVANIDRLSCCSIEMDCWIFEIYARCNYTKYRLTIYTFVIHYTVAEAQWNVSFTKSWICYCRCWCNFYFFLFCCQAIWEECTIVLHSPLSRFLFPFIVACVYVYVLNISSMFHWLFCYLITRTFTNITSFLRFSNIIHLLKHHNHMV